MIKKLVADLKVGDVVIMEDDKQRTITKLSAGIYENSRMIHLGYEEGKEIWSCLVRTETILVVEKENAS